MRNSALGGQPPNEPRINRFSIIGGDSRRKSLLKKHNLAGKTPQLEFNGLRGLYHLDDVTMFFRGINREGIKYFEIVDNYGEKVAYCIEAKAESSRDAVVKDRYGIPRFCIHGWNYTEQCDVYVSLNRPIGIIKDNVLYNKNKIPQFYFTWKTVFGYDTGYLLYQISTNRSVGGLYANSKLFCAQFDQLMDEGSKALILALGLRLCTTKYNMLLEPARTVRYDYKPLKIKHKLSKNEEEPVVEAGYRKQSQRVPINKNVKDEPTPETEEEPNTLQVIVLPLQTRESGQMCRTSSRLGTVSRCLLEPGIEYENCAEHIHAANSNR